MSDDQLDLFGAPKPLKASKASKASKARWWHPQPDLRDVERLIFAAHEGTGEAFRRLTPGALRELGRLARFFEVQGNDTPGWPRHVRFTPDGAIACKACQKCGNDAHKCRPFECIYCGTWNPLPRRRGVSPGSVDPIPDDDIPV